ncbi:MAG: hypothetical protein GX638_17450, partial [Crenarchaeota archaeon]|nr:hypothetical protein [Thermoproteota archaeon]
TGLVLASYYVRMMGRYRMQIALGGIEIGVGFTFIILAIFGLTGFSSFLIFMPESIKILLGIILIITGYLNLTAHSTKKILVKEKENNS